MLTVPGDPRTYVLPPTGADIPQQRAAPAATTPAGTVPAGLTPAGHTPAGTVPAALAPGGPAPAGPEPEPAAQPAGPTGRWGRWGRVLGRGAGLTTVFALGLGGALLVAIAALTRWFGAQHLATTGQLFLISLLLFTGHGLATRWAARPRPVRWWAVAVVQPPFLAGYAVGVAWYGSRRPFVRDTGFPPVYALWASAALGARVVLLFWYLREPRRVRRALAFLAGCAVVVVLNGAGLVALSWRATNGYGLVGPPTPWAAFTALTASSCLSPNTFYSFGDKLEEASCPSGPTADYYAGSYDQGRFNDLACSSQPRAAFEPWWQHGRDYEVAITLDFGAEGHWGIRVDGKPVPLPLPAVYAGAEATLSVQVRLQTALHLGGGTPVQQHPMANDKPTETWQVALSRQSVGGWKVCRIDVLDPIQVSRR